MLAGRRDSLSIAPLAAALSARQQCLWGAGLLPRVLDTCLGREVSAPAGGSPGGGPTLQSLACQILLNARLARDKLVSELDTLHA